MSSVKGWVIVSPHGNLMGNGIYESADDAWEYFLKQNGYGRGGLEAMGYVAKPLFAEDIDNEVSSD